EPGECGQYDDQSRGFQTRIFANAQKHYLLGSNVRTIKSASAISLSSRTSAEKFAASIGPKLPGNVIIRIRLGLGPRGFSGSHFVPTSDSVRARNTFCLLISC